MEPELSIKEDIFKNKDLLSRLKDYEKNFISNNNNNEKDEERKEILEQVFQDSTNIRNNFFKNYVSDISENLNGRSDLNSYQYMNFFRYYPNKYNNKTFSKNLKLNTKEKDNCNEIEDLNIYENNAIVIEKEADEQIMDAQISDDENKQINEINKLDENNIDLFKKLEDNNDKEPDYNSVQNNNNFYNDENIPSNIIDNIEEDKKFSDKNMIKTNSNSKLPNNIIEEAENYFKNKKTRFHNNIVLKNIKK